MLDFISGKLTIKEKSVVVIFDDGWLDNYLYAFPVLKKYDINAAIFVITDRTERASNIVKSQEAIIPPHRESKKTFSKWSVT